MCVRLIIFCNVSACIGSSTFLYFDTKYLFEFSIFFSNPVNRLVCLLLTLAAAPPGKTPSVDDTNALASCCRCPVVSACENCSVF